MSDRKKRDAAIFFKAMLAMGSIGGPESNSKSRSKSEGPGVALYDPAARARRKVERKLRKASAPNGKKRLSARKVRLLKERARSQKEARLQSCKENPPARRYRAVKPMSRHYAGVIRRIGASQVSKSARRLLESSV